MKVRHVTVARQKYCPLIADMCKTNHCIFWDCVGSAFHGRCTLATRTPDSMATDVKKELARCHKVDPASAV